MSPAFVKPYCSYSGEYRKPTADENIYYKRLDSDLVEGCQLLGPLDRVRYLGWFTAMSNEVDESFKQMKEECDERLGKMASKRCTGGEFMQFVKIAEVPRMLHRMRHSNTGKDSIDKIQTMYNRTYRLKGRIVRTMPNEIMWSSKNRCGMEWVNFWDEISIDRTVAWMKHANSGGDVGKIAASAIKRSEEIAPSSTAVLEQTEKPTWDGTMLGRIVEWMTGDIGKDFSITGGSTNRGNREKDIAIADINRGHRWQAMVAAGCRLTGIHWISEILTSDDNTWITEVQPNGKFNNNGSFEWKHITYDTKTAERKTLRKRNKWSRKRGSVFGRIWETQNQSRADMMEQESVVTGESEEEIITQFLPICGEGNDRKRNYRAETNQSRVTRMNERNEKWREKARLIGKNASILAGGDGSRISRNGETVAAYGWGVYGIGEHSVDYWKAKHNSEVHIMASGGNMDWAPEYARSNTRAEQTHILAAMIQLFQTGINVLYSVD